MMTSDNQTFPLIIIIVALVLWLFYMVIKTSNEAGTTASNEAGTTASNEAGTTASNEAGTTASNEAGTTASNEAGTTASNEAGTTASNEAETLEDVWNRNDRKYKIKDDVQNYGQWITIDKPVPCRTNNDCGEMKKCHENVFICVHEACSNYPSGSILGCFDMTCGTCEYFEPLHSEMTENLEKLYQGDEGFRTSMQNILESKDPNAKWNIDSYNEMFGSDNDSVRGVFQAILLYLVLIAQKSESEILNIIVEYMYPSYAGTSYGPDGVQFIDIIRFVFGQQLKKYIEEFRFFSFNAPQPPSSNNLTVNERYDFYGKYTNFSELYKAKVDILKQMQLSTDVQSFLDRTTHTEFFKNDRVIEQLFIDMGVNLLFDD